MKLFIEGWIKSFIKVQTLQLRTVGENVQLFAKKLIPMMTIKVLFQNLLLRIHGIWIVPFQTYLKISKTALEKMLW